jgi:hypothetical protein
MFVWITEYDNIQAFFYVVFAGCHEVKSSGLFVQTCKPASVFGFGIPQVEESYLVQDFDVVLTVHRR